MSSFRVAGIPHEPFEPLFHLPDEALARRGALRIAAAESFGFPCRVSLEDANTGDELLLLSWPHQPVSSPYRSSGPIYVRRGVTQRVLPPGELPPYVTRRVISVRGYDAADMMIDASVRDGADVAAEIERMFGNRQVHYIHLHNAKPGCFSCRVDRVMPG